MWCIWLYLLWYINVYICNVSYKSICYRYIFCYTWRKRKIKEKKVKNSKKVNFWTKFKFYILDFKLNTPLVNLLIRIYYLHIYNSNLCLSVSLFRYSIKVMNKLRKWRERKWRESEEKESEEKVKRKCRESVEKV